ncbi:MAG: tRNA (guanosine(46)-N7)-methyltransferase TrmB [Firmicutes bacterium]|nr:tRNA (guanosine(46)-N7)-methyltransferase TrmB [Bacillota bacterium]
MAAHERVLLENDAPVWRGKWRSLFGREQDAPLHLEIGIGRGRFILKSCEARPEVCFLGLELRAEMVMQAIERVKELPENLYLLQLNAQLLPELFTPGEIDVIYINFPDPWPKTKHAKRRLTAPEFLQIYKQVLRDEGEIRFKTDNEELFEWSLLTFEQQGFRLRDVDHDLSEEDSGVITEYEKRFRTKGQPIYYACAVK